MKKNGRYRPGGKAQSFTRSDQIGSEPPNSFQFIDVPPSNSLYPDVAVGPLLRNNNYGPVRDGFPSGSRPPWQMNRDNFGSNQNPRTESPLRFRDLGSPIPQSKDSQGWNKGRQSMPFSQQNNMNSIGWTNQDKNMSQWRPEEPSRMNRQGDMPNNQWYDRSAACEKGRWNNMPTRANEPIIRSQGPLESNQMDRFGGASSTKWSNQRGESKESPHWIDKPVRHPDWKERSQEHKWHNRRGPSPEPRGEGMPREETSWRNRIDGPQNDEWNQQKRQPEGWTKNQPDRDSNSRDWNKRPRNSDEPGWTNKPRPEQNLVWSNPPRDWGQSNQRDTFTESGGIPIPQEANFGRNSGSAAISLLEKAGGRKRGRSPDNRNVWSRLEPQGVSNDNHMNKKLRAAEQPDSRISDEVLAMIERERMNLNFHNDATPLVERQSRPSSNDLRLKLSSQDSPSPDRKRSFQVIFSPHFKKSKYQIRDKTQIYDKLVGDLYKLAQSGNIEDLPQLRFDNFRMISTSRIVVDCYDATTAKWLLKWDHGPTRLPIRKILPEDPHHLAIIGFDMKGLCNIMPETMKTMLRIQNPGLDVSCWLDGEIRTSKRGKVYAYKVDGHTLRYLVHNKWELFFDMQKLFVRVMNKNSDFNPNACDL